jgi:hypothetical protein
VNVSAGLDMDLDSRELTTIRSKRTYYWDGPAQGAGHWIFVGETILTRQMSRQLPTAFTRNTLNLEYFYHRVALSIFVCRQYWTIFGGILASSHEVVRENLFLNDISAELHRPLSLRSIFVVVPPQLSVAKHTSQFLQVTRPI